MRRSFFEIADPDRLAIPVRRLIGHFRSVKAAATKTGIPRPTLTGWAGGTRREMRQDVFAKLLRIAADLYEQTGDPGEALLHGPIGVHLFLALQDRAIIRPPERPRSTEELRFRIGAKDVLKAAATEPLNAAHDLRHAAEGVSTLHQRGAAEMICKSFSRVVERIEREGDLAVRIPVSASASGIPDVLLRSIRLPTQLAGAVERRILELPRRVEIWSIAGTSDLFVIALFPDLSRSAAKPTRRAA